MTTLLIGTTGMLSEAAKHMVQAAPGTISVVSRRADTFSFGDADLDDRTTSHPVDWQDQAAFLATLDAIASNHGPFTQALVWMHGRDDPLRAHIAHHMADDSVLVEVLGSAASRPGAFGDIRVRQMQASPHIRYRQVLLGFVYDDGQSRWLTHAEICAGTIEALSSDETVTVAGQVEPWELKP
ncbi:MAG: hypothetical protein ACFB0Z_01680 [Candidatus Phaeomarinobacter sp.]